MDLTGSAGLLALLTVDTTDKAEEHFLPDYGGFMPLHANQHQANDALSTVGDNDGDNRETTLCVHRATNTRDPFEFFAALTVGGYDWLRFTPSDGRPTEPGSPNRTDHGYATPPTQTAPGRGLEPGFGPRSRS